MSEHFSPIMLCFCLAGCWTFRPAGYCSSTVRKTLLKSKNITSTYFPLCHNVQGTSRLIKVKCLEGFAMDRHVACATRSLWDARRWWAALRERRNRRPVVAWGFLSSSGKEKVTQLGPGGSQESLGLISWEQRLHFTSLGLYLLEDLCNCTQGHDQLMREKRNARWEILGNSAKTRLCSTVEVLLMLLGGEDK